MESESRPNIQAWVIESESESKLLAMCMIANTTHINYYFIPYYCIPLFLDLFVLGGCGGGCGLTTGKECGTCGAAAAGNLGP